MSSLDFTGKRVLVTGGTKGIGEAVVIRMRDGGATVFSTARAVPIGSPSSTFFVAADISTTAGADLVASRALLEMGGVDVIVNVVEGRRLLRAAMRHFPIATGFMRCKRTYSLASASIARSSQVW